MPKSNKKYNANLSGINEIRCVTQGSSIFCFIILHIIFSWLNDLYDVKFNLNVKPAEQKRDEFDDDEENPLAKIPTKPRIPKQKQTTGTLGASIRLAGKSLSLFQ
ncbi:Protein CBG18117 [Caenorhabditis briggsae]|uniref:Protein CBG18117 n=1 Tax=Caenorhabditis briggsae TaxID=6238 RepID=B0K0A4_CAEBR|nr:Protein CBG18117 [Caenorhabditis briggsae]CAP35627.1 Protein CBG18117 [Caenorhabditis briggsae]